MNETEAFITQLCRTKFQLIAEKIAHYDNYTASEKQPQNQNALSILNELGVKLLGKNIISDTVKINSNQSSDVVEIMDQNRCILFGQPRIARNQHAFNAQNDVFADIKVSTLKQCGMFA